MMRDKKWTTGPSPRGRSILALEKISEVSLTGLNVYTSDGGGFTFHNTRTRLINAQFQASVFSMRESSIS